MAGKIQILVSPEGEVTITVKGVKGKACKEMTRRYEEALGKAVKVEKTKEFFEKPLKTSETVSES